MKKLFLLLVSMCVLLISCESENMENISNGTQDNFKPEITINQSDKNIHFSVEGGNKYISIESNIDYDIEETSNWLSVEKISGGIRLSSEISTSFDTAKTKVRIFNLEYNISQYINVNQAGLPEDKVIVYTADNKSSISTSVGYGANMIKHWFHEGQGFMLFDGEVTTIPEYAFLSSNITSLTIPSKVTKIGNKAIWNCEQLSTVICKPVNAPSIYWCSHWINYGSDMVYEGTFYQKEDVVTVNIYVPEQSKGYYPSSGKGGYYSVDNWYYYEHHMSRIK